MHKVNVERTPNDILLKTLEAWDQIAKDESEKNPFFKKVLDSQRAFAERAGAWQNDYTVDFKMAYNHYFGKTAKKT